MQEIRFDELQAGDVILFHGARVKVVTVDIQPAPADWNTAEKYVTFKLEPADVEALQIMGWYYSHGTYATIGCIPVVLIERGA